MIAIIVAIAQNNAIGYENKLIYWLPNDLKRFKALTTGNTIIMGRRTFESLPKGALPNRRNIVLTRQEGMTFPHTETFHSLQEALQHVEADEKVFIIGGASLYNEAMAQADELYVTLVDDTPAQADAFFPTINTDEWVLENSEAHEVDEKHNHHFWFNDYKRKK